VIKLFVSVQVAWSPRPCDERVE